MHQLYGLNRDACHFKWFILGNGFYLELRSTGIRIFSESIGKPLLHLLDDGIRCIQLHPFVLHKDIGPNIVQSNDMVVVLVGEHNSIEAFDACPQHLLPEVGPDVNDYVAAFVRHE